MVTSQPRDPSPDDDWAARIPSGTALLVTGPPLTGKRELGYRLLADGRGERGATVFVTTLKVGTTVAGEYREVHADQAPDLLSVVDAVGEGSTHGGDDRLQYARGPGDLTGIGIQASKALESFETRGDVADVRFGFHSLSPLLMYSDLERVYRFLHVLTGRIRTAGHVGMFVLTESEGSSTVDALGGLFEGMVQVRDEGERELRVRGIDVGPSAWTPF